MQQAMAEQEELKQYNKAMAIAELQKRQAEVNKINAEAEKIRAEAASNPDLAGHQAEAQKAIADAREEAKEQIDSMTVEIMTLRNSSALREQQLREQMAKLRQQADTVLTKADTEREVALIQKEIAEIEAARDVKVAQLEKDRNETAQKMMATVEKKLEALTKQVQQSKKSAKE